MKIALVMAHGRVHEHVGGAPKVFFDMSNELSTDNTIMSIYSDDSEGSPLYTVNEGVKLVNLKVDKRKINSTSLKLIRELVRGWNKLPLKKWHYNPITSRQQSVIGERLLPYLKSFQPDIIVSYGHWDLVSITDYYRDEVPIISMSHTDTSREAPFMSSREVKAMEKAALCQVLLPSYIDAVKKHVSTKLDVVALGNAIPDFHGDCDSSRKSIIYMARIEKNKQQHKLISCFADIDISVRSEWRIELYGSNADPEYRKHLDSLIENRGLSGHVFFHGVTDQVELKLKQSSICAFPSAFEGFPLALSEAMSSGLACMGFSACSGVNEVLSHKNNGLLANNDTEFTQLLSSLMEDEKYRCELGKKAYISISSYHCKYIWARWRELISRYH
ncbi:glycosyltransferase [Vibrio scophthalmi]|uniref:Poly(Glycerol-phosphate) alpha-glucosyltransferase n=1 Tax=Vibrio scophthalmi TaxID=45658 RepID=A0A1C7FFD3_9VIBR|nr:glycosyltransferase [Vibrio scophthalmi]ANU37719.1 Poly(glycerol-phosphate) alpha-glucosyltransferase [Vibrio scophthalmi]